MRQLMAANFAMLLSLVLLACRSGTAHAEDAPSTVTSEPVPAPPPWKLSGYVEADWQHNFARPENGITNYRGFDNRSDTITLSNVSLAVDWDAHDVIGKLALQIGHTPSTYYLAEPTRSGSAGSNASNAELWKYIQQAYVGYRFHPWSARSADGSTTHARDLTVQAGVFLSPIGPESMIVHENWNWSRSNLFFGCPFYHTGARAVQQLSDAWSVTLAVYSGWNSVVDNNAQKSLSAQALYAPSAALTLSMLYFGGVERDKRDPAGQPWRHLFDSWLMLHATRALSVLAHANGGFESTRFGTTYWGAGALSVRYALTEQLSVAARGDRLEEHTARDGRSAASPLFFPTRWVSSGTATLDYHPADTISFRLEYRHDSAATPIYYAHRVPSDNAPNGRQQDTVTLGATAWF